MEKNIGNQALIPNPALAPLQVLVGTWHTTGTHPYLPGITLHGRTSFAWHLGGAFLIMHSEIDDPNIPSGVAIFGSDNDANQYFMLYFDERGISRKHDVTITTDHISWYRNEPTFSQRCTITIADHGNKLISKGEMSRNGAPWEDDLALTYTRLP